MFHVAAALLLLFFSSGHGNYRKLLNEVPSIPKDINDIHEQLKDEPHMNPPSKYDFDKLLAESEDIMPVFDEDLININSKRFEDIKQTYEMKEKYRNLGVKEDNVTERNILRKPNKPVLVTNRKAVDRALALMSQFVYAARYKLQYGQILRKNYHNVLDYKIGYCFGLMRDIRKKQMFLYTTMHFNYRIHQLEKHPSSNRWSPYWSPTFIYDVYSYSDFSGFFLIYERIVKLDVNMLDVVNLVQELIYQKSTSTEDPNKQVVPG